MSDAATLARINAPRRALARARFELLCRASEAGDEREEAARRAGLTLAGMTSLLYRRLGSTAWPFDSSADRGRRHA